MERIKVFTINEYIDACEPSTKPYLIEMYNIIKEVVPDSEEVISYGMPAFKQHGILVYFAANKNHVGFYPTGSGITPFIEDIKDFKSSKGAIQFPYDKPLPKELIQKITKFRLNQNIDKEYSKKQNKIAKK